MRLVNALRKGRAVSLHVQFRPCNDHSIHQNAGDLNLSRRKAPTARKTFDLYNDNPTRILYRHGLGEVVYNERLLLSLPL